MRGKKTVGLAGFALTVLTVMAATTMGEQDWRAEADRRIETVRKGDFSLDLAGPSGEKTRNAEVSVRQIGSHFLFGTCVTGNPLSANANEQAYFRFIRGFYGDYEVDVVTADGTRLRGTAFLAPSVGNVVVRLTNVK